MVRNTYISIRRSRRCDHLHIFAYTSVKMPVQLHLHQLITSKKRRCHGDWSWAYTLRRSSTTSGASGSRPGHDSFFAPRPSPASDNFAMRSPKPRSVSRRGVSWSHSRPRAPNPFRCVPANIGAATAQIVQQRGAHASRRWPPPGAHPVAAATNALDEALALPYHFSARIAQHPAVLCRSRAPRGRFVGAPTMEWFDPSACAASLAHIAEVAEHGARRRPSATASPSCALRARRATRPARPAATCRGEQQGGPRERGACRNSRVRAGSS